MKKIFKLILICVLLSLGPPGTYAQLVENESTAAAINEPAAIFIISEISFKNSTADFLKIYYKSPSGKNINLKGISFKDDSIFKKIESDFIVPSDSYITLNFKSGLADLPPNLYTTHTGLTGTTEQLIILDRNQKIPDALCWTSSTPTTSELSDHAKMVTAGGWNSADINSCFPSDTVKTNQTLMRIELLDTNSKEDWRIKPEPAAAAGTENTTSSSGQTAAATSASAASAASGSSKTAVKTTTAKTSATTKATATSSKTTAAKTTAKPAAAAVKKTAAKTTASKAAAAAKFKNGGLSDTIHISEFLPAPDKNKNQPGEWIEIVNTGEEDVNLGNWQIDDKGGASKPYTFPDTTIISAGSVMLIEAAESKISLANTTDSVRLLNFNGEIIDDISYEDAPKGQSYSLINTITPEENFSGYIWTKDPTPNEPNPEYFEKTGKIITPAAFETEYFFEIEDEQKIISKIFFDEATIAGPLAKVSFTTDSTGKFLIDSNNKLIKFEILGNAPPKQNNGLILPLIILSFITLISGALYLMLKKTPPAVTIQK